MVNRDWKGYEIDFDATDPVSTAECYIVSINYANCNWNTGHKGGGGPGGPGGPGKSCDFKTVIFPSYQVVKINGEFVTYKVTGIGTGSTLLNFGDYMDIVIPETVTTIGDGAFGYNITGVSFSGEDNIVSIGSQAFIGLLGSSFTFGTKLKTIGTSAFQGSRLNSVVFPEGSNIDSIGQYAFAYCYYLTKVHFSDSTVTTIDAYAFVGNSNITSADFTNTKIDSIGECAFYQNSLSGTIDLRNSGITSIGSQAFYGQYNNSELIIDIPDTVDYIGSQFVTGCSGKVTVNFYGITEEEAHAKFASDYDTIWSSNTTFNYGL